MMDSGYGTSVVINESTMGRIRDGFSARDAINTTVVNNNGRAAWANPTGWDTPNYGNNNNNNVLAPTAPQQQQQRLSGYDPKTNTTTSYKNGVRHTMIGQDFNQSAQPVETQAKYERRWSPFRDTSYTEPRDTSKDMSWDEYENMMGTTIKNRLWHETNRTPRSGSRPSAVPELSILEQDFRRL